MHEKWGHLDLVCLFISRVGWVLGLAPVPPLPDERVRICMDLVYLVEICSAIPALVVLIAFYPQQA